MKKLPVCLLGITLLSFQPGPDDPRPVISLLGEVLPPVSLPDDVLQDRLQKLEEARKNYHSAENDPDAIIWFGRRTAYLGYYHEAIDIYTRGIERHPSDARFYRHRGHRYISTRQLEEAIQDLEKAAQLTSGKEDVVEPDGLPNARNIPTSTLQSNIWYHLGLARYLTGDFAAALESYEECMNVSKNNDMLVATSHWIYMTLRRMGRLQRAESILEPIHGGMEIIENDGYYRLLLMYKGILSENDLMDSDAGGIQSATVGYGVANWHYFNGRTVGAGEIFRQILHGEQWAAFGYIAAEAEVFRSR